MKILCLADETDKRYWDYFRRESLQDIDLIISCGDLKPEYLSFLVTMGHAPVLYVHGNHDEIYAVRPPEGCDCIEDKLWEFKGLRILGLGGSVRYRPGSHQYTQEQMSRRIRKLRWKLRKGVDIVVTHAPVADHGDLPDYTHRGFTAFQELIRRYCPKYLLHGHIHLNYGSGMARIHRLEETCIINVSGSYILELPDPEQAKQKTL